MQYDYPYKIAVILGVPFIGMIIIVFLFAMIFDRGKKRINFEDEIESLQLRMQGAKNDEERAYLFGQIEIYRRMMLEKYK